MSRIQFQCDYNEGAHPLVLQRLVETNMEQTVGYGEDDYCAAARKLIQKVCDAPLADVHFLVGGTQSNATIISHLLRPYDGVIAADTAHIAVHETGAIEHGGHKVLTLPAEHGKITARQVHKMVFEHLNDSSFEHMVRPGMVYISFPTELGTIYSHQELKELREVCDCYNLPLFIDGARLGYGLVSPSCDVSLPELAALADVFYIGGTKVGALFGEAVVISNDALKPYFRYSIKQGGGMLAKGRLLGLQYQALFTDELYFNISRHAVKLANQIKEALKACGVDFLTETDTNQIFPIFPDEWIEALSKEFLFSYWQRIDTHRSAVRICTSWATKESNVEALLKAIARLASKS